MNRILLIVFIFLLALKSNSLRLFLLGWTANDEEPEIYDAIAKSTSKIPQPNKCNQDWTKTTCPKIAVVTSAAEDQASGNYTYETDVNNDTIGYRELFIKHGLSPNHVSIHIDNYKITTDKSTEKGIYNLEIIKQADIIYFDGGDQAKHARCWLLDNQDPNQFLEVIKLRATNNEVVLAGTSAGTMIMSPKTFGGGRSFGIWYFANSVGLAPKNVSDGDVGGTGLDDVRNGTQGLQYDQNGGKIAGFGFVDFLADTHFEARGRLGRIVPAMLDMNMNIGVGVDLGTALDWNDGIGKVIGKNGVYIVDVTDAKRLPKQDYFQLRNVKVHYLTQNDSFNFKNKQLISSKPLIKFPYYIQPTDSSDILQSQGNQCKLLITRLVDQKPYYNVGRAKIPNQNYPKDCPKLQMIFYKNSDTKGYFSNGKYTSSSVLIDYDYIQ